MSTIAKGISAHLSAVEKAEVRENIGTNSISEIDAKDALKIDITRITTSSTDTTAGRLLKVGDFGVGGNVALINNDDLNDYITPFSKNVFGAGCSNRPTENVYLVEVHGSHDTTRVTQVAYNQEIASIESFNSVYFRRTADGGTSWTGWRELFHTGNILGTVSQTAGVPTGAIFESGSNLNGSYVKYADGTLICTSPYINHNSTAVNNFAIGTYGWSFYSASTTWPFPATLISQPSVSASAGENIAGATVGGISSVETISTTQVSVSTWRMDNTLTRVKCSAIGRWW